MYSDNRTEVLEKLAERTISYFKDDLSLDIDNNYEIINVSKIDYLDLTTIISLSSDMIGSLGMSVSNNLAFTMVESFIFGEMPKDELKELCSENLAETLNITLGNIIQELSIIKNGGKINISTPYTLNNPVTITKKKDGTMYLCKLQSNKESIILSYMI